MTLIQEVHILFAVRVVLGTVMLYYGWPKVRDLRQNAKDFVGMGFAPGWLWGTMVAFTEFCGGLLLIVGVWPELFAGAFGFQMVMGALWKKKAGKPFPDYSYDLLALTNATVIMMFGAGMFSFAPFTHVFLLRPELVAGALGVALLGAGLSRPRMT